MTRIALFLATIGVALSGVAALNWWIDPAGDRLYTAPIDAALAHSPPCLISIGVVRPPAFADLKLDLFRRARATVVVVGTSRVAKISARPGERRFVNMGAPGTGPTAVVQLFRRLHAQTSRRLTVYLGVENFWFNPGWQDGVSFGVSALKQLERLLSAETTRATAQVLWNTPGAIRHPRALLSWHIIDVGGKCIVDTGSSALNGSLAAWGPDGSLYFHDDLPGLQGGAGVDWHLLDATQPQLDRSKVVKLDQALGLAQSYGWNVVGFLPPVSDVRAKLAALPKLPGQLAAFRRTIPPLFRRHGFRFVDLFDARRVPCKDTAFSMQDSIHADAACGATVRRRLDAAAATPAKPR